MTSSPIRAKTGQKERPGKNVSGRAEGGTGESHELRTRLIGSDPDLGSRLVPVDCSQGSGKHLRVHQLASGPHHVGLFVQAAQQDRVLGHTATHAEVGDQRHVVALPLRGGKTAV